jgi:hypothetical protein
MTSTMSATVRCRRRGPKPWSPSVSGVQLTGRGIDDMGEPIDRAGRGLVVLAGTSTYSWRPRRRRWHPDARTGGSIASPASWTRRAARRDPAPPDVPRAVDTARAVDSRTKGRAAHRIAAPSEGRRRQAGPPAPAETDFWKAASRSVTRATSDRRAHEFSLTTSNQPHATGATVVLPASDGPANTSPSPSRHRGGVRKRPWRGRAGRRS